MKENNPFWYYLLHEHGGDEQAAEAEYKEHFRRAGRKSIKTRKRKCAQRESVTPTPDAYVALLLSLAPKLSDEQRVALAELLKPLRVGGGDR